MRKIAKEKYLKGVKKRLGRIPKINCPTITVDTEIFILHVLSFLPKKYIQYVEKKVVFHEPKHSSGKDQEFATCVSVKSKKAPDYLIMFDSAFRYLSNDYKKLFIAHELGHVFLGSDDNKNEEDNEDAANDFVVKYFIDGDDYVLGFL